MGWGESKDVLTILQGPLAQPEWQCPLVWG